MHVNTNSKAFNRPGFGIGTGREGKGREGVVWVRSGEGPRVSGSRRIRGRCEWAQALHAEVSYKQVRNAGNKGNKVSEPGSGARSKVIAMLNH
jgi:hypothetical protein